MNTLAYVPLLLAVVATLSEPELVIPQGPLIAGTTIEICVECGTPNSTETIFVESPATHQCDTIVITTDANGDGCAEWVVPSWPLALFQWGDEEIGDGRFIEELALDLDAGFAQ